VPLSRRTILHGAAATSAVLALGVPARAPAATDEKAWRHGLSLFGDLKYPPGFKRFDYVNPDAPKGGAVRLLGLGTFDNFNFVVESVKGNIAPGIELMFDTLIVQALDEVSTAYGLLAESMTYPADYSLVTYRLRSDARFHDGHPVTVEDVIFSFEAFKANSPFYSTYYGHVAKIEKTGEREITFTFNSPGNRELPQIVGELRVLPKHWWEGNDSSGKKRDVTTTTLEPLLGNGAYRIKEFVPGRSIVYERVKDYWGKDLNVNIGRNNFDELRFEFYRDSTVALEGFKADRLDWRTENSAKNWATAYDFPAINDKRVVKEEFVIRSRGIMQAFVFNSRREQFKDARLRRAFNYALDFEEMNKQMFFDKYQRITSYFDGTELASSGLPSGQELEILETVRDKVPPEVFTKAYTNPVGGNPDAVRSNLREGIRLLKEAGYDVQNQRLVNTNSGRPLTVEFLIQANDPNSERFVLFYKPSLERLGIQASVRAVDDAQYENRMRKWDFDMVTASWPESLSPGNEQRGYWSSQAADQAGSHNLVGIKNPAIDTLIDRVIFAKSREELVAATKALDRVLLWNHYVVPQWTYPYSRTARWDRFGRPDKLPEYGASDFPTIWWWDAEKAAKAGSRS
jgi:microcin C transport system substrate-binding protein